ncbi:MAG: ABC transporter ATP-binding protein, partial [Planctomycetota bacterium]
LGLLYPTNGAISVLGKQPTDVQLKRRIGYLPEESNLYRFLNAEETLDFYARLFGLAAEERAGRVESLLDMVGLSAARYRPVGEYSKGMQRRVGLAQALINDPDLLILDEPTTGMDPIATRQIKDLILTLKQRGKTIILCTHLLGEVEDVCDRLVIMYGGKIRRQGTVEELLTVPGKQAIEVTGGELTEETIDKLGQVLQGEGRSVQEVRAPRQKLESIFLGVIDEATTAGEATTGAAVGQSVADFLGGDAEGDQLLEALSTQKVREVVPPAPGSPDAGISPDDLMPPVEEPDLAALDEIANQPVPPAGEAVDTDAPAPGHTTDQSEVPADDEFLSDLSGSKQNDK